MKNLQKRVELFGILEKLSYLSHGNHTSGSDSVLISKQKRRKIEHINKHYPFDI